MVRMKRTRHRMPRALFGGGADSADAVHKPQCRRLRLRKDQRYRYLVKAGLAKSKSEARRLIEQAASASTMKR